MSSRILVIEDEARIADFLVRGLREEGYQIEHAADGPSGWISLQHGAWDLVLLDWWLPGEDGISLLRRFRAKDRKTPVLFLTAQTITCASRSRSRSCSRACGRCCGGPSNRRRWRSTLATFTPISAASGRRGTARRWN